MAKGRHQKDKLWLIHDELRSSQKCGKRAPVPEKDFCHCALTYVPFKPEDRVVADSEGRLYSELAALTWSAEYDCHPATGEPLGDWLPVQLSWGEAQDVVCPLTGKPLNAGSLKVVMNKKNGFVYSAAGLKTLCAGNETTDPMDCSPLNQKQDLLVLYDPNRPPRAPETPLTEQFLAKKRRKAPMGSLNSRLTGLTQRILSKIKDEAPQTLLPLTGCDDGKAEEGYKDPITGEVKLVRSKLHTSGATSASLTSTAATREYGQQFKYLTSHEYRNIVYQRMMKRRKQNSEVAVSLQVRDAADVAADSLRLQLTLFAWKFPEAVHQMLIAFLKNSVKLLQVADDRNDPAGAREALWFACPPAFPDVDDEIELITRHGAHEDFVPQGAVFKCLEVPGVVGIAARGFPKWSESMHIVGQVSNGEKLEALMQRVDLQELLVRQSFVHANPYEECERLAIAEYLA